MIVDDSLLLHSELLHEYDPVKAREYYLRTRKLKGRKKGSQEEEKTRSGSAKATSKAKPPTKKLSSAERRRAKQAEIAALKKRLERLKEVLAKLVKEAKARSGVKDETPKEKANRNTEAKSRKPLTAAQKKAQSERAKKAYEKEKKQSPDQELKALQDKIRDIRAKIKAALAEAEKHQKTTKKERRG